MPATQPKNTSTKYENSKHHRIYLTAKGRPFTRSAAGKKSMGAKARFVSSNNGTVRKITPGNMKNIPNAMRPAVRQGDKKPKTVTKADAKRVARPRLNNEARATRMFSAILNKTRKPPKAKASARPRAVKGAASKTRKGGKDYETHKGDKNFHRNNHLVKGTPFRAVRKNKGVARKSNANKAATVAARRMMASAKRAAAKGPRKVRSNKGVARGPREGTVQRRMNTASKRAAAKGPRKVRSNKGVSRNLIKSPGGTLYKGMAAFTRALKKL